MRKAWWLLAGVAVLALAVGLCGCGGVNEATGIGVDTAAKPVKPPPVPVPTPCKIAFDRTVDGVSQVFTMYTNGTGVSQLTGTGGGSAPCWSADGQRICFTRNSDGYLCLFTMDEDGQGVTQVTEPSGGDQTGPHWCWAPGTDKVAFYRDDADGWGGLAVLEGGQVTLICPGRTRSPTWSPGGSLILFECSREGSPSLLGEVYTVPPVEGATPTRVLSGIAAVCTPAWSPQGDKVAYYSGNSVWVVPVNPQTCEQTGPPVKLPPPPDTYPAWFPTWSPDGEYVAYCGDVYNKQGKFTGIRRIYKSKADGTAPAEYLADGTNPEWSPAVF